jgi:hypothetical protein
VAIHLHDLLVAVASLSDLVERIVGRILAALDHLPGEPEGGRSLFALGLELLHAPDLVLAQAYVLCNSGVYGQAVPAPL